MVQVEIQVGKSGASEATQSKVNYPCLQQRCRESQSSLDDLMPLPARNEREYVEQLVYNVLQDQCCLVLLRLSHNIATDSRGHLESRRVDCCGVTDTTRIFPVDLAGCFPQQRPRYDRITVRSFRELGRIVPSLCIHLVAVSHSQP